MTRRARPTNRRSDDGFALVLVIWGVGLVAALVLSFLLAARVRVQTAINVVDAAQAEQLADAGFNVARLAIMAQTSAPGRTAPRLRSDGAPLFCSMPQGAAAEIDIAEEAGKIDVNAASRKRLRRLLRALGESARRARRLAAAIVAFRTPQNGVGDRPSRMQSDSLPGPGPKGALFQSVLELDQVSGMTERLARGLEAMTTVYSQRSEFNPRFAPPALIAAFSGASPAAVRALIAHPYPNAVDRRGAQLKTRVTDAFASAYRAIHAEAMTANGSVFVRDGVVALATTGLARTPTIVEWRSGASHYSRILRRLIAPQGGAAARLSPC